VIPEQKGLVADTLQQGRGNVIGALSRFHDVDKNAEITFNKNNRRGQH
jgi:hypothetical protein